MWCNGVLCGNPIDERIARTETHENSARCGQSFLQPYSGGCFFFSDTFAFWVDTLKGPPIPKTPLPVPPPDKKGYHSAPFWILHPSAYLSRPEIIMPQSYGTKIEIRTPMPTWLTRHPQLACTTPHCFLFIRIPLTISCWHNPGSLSEVVDGAKVLKMFLFRCKSV